MIEAYHSQSFINNIPCFSPPTEQDLPVKTIQSGTFICPYFSIGPRVSDPNFKNSLRNLRELRKLRKSSNNLDLNLANGVTKRHFSSKFIQTAEEWKKLKNKLPTTPGKCQADSIKSKSIYRNKSVNKESEENNEKFAARHRESFANTMPKITECNIVQPMLLNKKNEIQRKKWTDFNEKSKKDIEKYDNLVLYAKRVKESLTKKPKNRPIKLLNNKAKIPMEDIEIHNVIPAISNMKASVYKMKNKSFENSYDKANLYTIEEVNEKAEINIPNISIKAKLISKK